MEVSWLAIWALKFAAWLLVNVFKLFGRNISGSKSKYAIALIDLRTVIVIFLWALACWVTFKILFAQALADKSGWVDNFERVLAACAVSSAVFLSEKAIIRVIKAAYHDKSFSTREKHCETEITLLTLLYNISQNSTKDVRMKANGEITSDKQEDEEAFDRVTSISNDVISGIRGNRANSTNPVINALEEIESSKILAEGIWFGLTTKADDKLRLNDFKQAFGPKYKTEANELSKFIDADDNNNINLDEITRKVISISIENKAIQKAKADLDQALLALNEVLLFAVTLIIIFIFLSFLNSSLLTTVATAGTVLLSLSFVFSVTAQEFLGSCIFLFAKHPYDVNDLVVITDVEMRVERISLLYTTFTHTDSMQTVQIPNIILNGLWINNITRSETGSERFTINIWYNTPLDDVNKLCDEIQNSISENNKTRDFRPELSYIIDSVNDLDKLTLTISIKYKYSWHDDQSRRTRRSKYMRSLILALNKTPIYSPSGVGTKINKLQSGDLSQEQERRGFNI
ncbi:Mechanosensitive ion channel domain-containing protein [Trichoderma velutinum]